jgi:hypothetical protein
MRGRRNGAHYLDEVEARMTTYHIDEYGNYVNTSADGLTRTDLIGQIAEEKSRLDGVSNVYQTADRIISGDSSLVVSVVNDKNMDTTAKNNGREVIFNANLIEDLDTDTIVSMNGTNYHELGHILFSPRSGSSLGQYVHNNNMKRAFNMLEEARIERLLIAKYPATRLFLEATVLDYALKDSPDNWGNMFPVITGRRYLDLDVRQMIADKFINSHGADLAQIVSKIVNEYAGLVFPTDFTRGMELIAEYSELVGLDTTPQGESPVPNGDGDGHNHNDRNVLQKGRPASTKEQERLQSKNGDGVGESLEGNTPIKGDKSEDGMGGDTPARGVGESGEYTGAESSYTNSDEEIAKALTQRLKDIRNDSRIKNEVRDIRKAITGNDELRSTLKNSNYNDIAVNVTASNFARRFGVELERMVRDSDPHWDRFLPSGKLNVTRTMTPDVNAIGQMFDVWDTGNENTDIEAVILLDNSGSMGGYMTEVCEKAWIIKRGIETIDGSVTVYNFHSYSELLYDKKDKAKPRQHRNVYATGSTNPMTALVEAERTLSTTDKHIKMLFIVTDGEWSNTEECDSIIKRLNDKGVVTCVVFMGDYEAIGNYVAEAKGGDEWAQGYIKRLRHNASIFKAVAKPKDVLELAVDIVKSKVGK